MIRHRGQKQLTPDHFETPFEAALDADNRWVRLADCIPWDELAEGYYQQRYGCYPQVVIADSLYGTRDKRGYLKRKGIRFAGKPLGRPKKVTSTNHDKLKAEKAGRREEYLQRIPIEGKFGQGKNVRRQAAELGLDMLPSIEYRWQSPEGPETIDFGELHYLMTPRQALLLARHNEQRACACFQAIPTRLKTIQ